MKEHYDLIFDWKDVSALCEYILGQDYLRIPFDKKNIKELHRQAALANTKNIAYGLKARYPAEARKLALLSKEKVDVNGVPFQFNNWNDVLSFLSVYVYDSDIERFQIDKEIFEYIKSCVLEMATDSYWKSTPVDECWILPDNYAPSLDGTVVSGEDFENYCARLLIKNGYINVETTKGSGDHGVDVLADLNLLAVGMVNDIFVENQNDDYDYEEVAGQEDFDAF